MLLAFLTFIAAFFIEALGTWVSIIGLSAFLGSDPIILALAAALDAGKLLSVTILYKWWKKLNMLMRTYMVAAVIITMSITSAGAFGYLSASFQKTIIPTKTGLVEVDALKKEKVTLTERKTELSKRKEQIDKQIAELPSNYVRSRQKLINEFKEESSLVLKESNEISKRLLAIEKDIAEKEVQNIDVQAHAGPILFVSEAFNIPLEQAVKYIILMIIFVFDPLAVVLVISGNFLLDKHRERKPEPKVEKLPEILPITEVKQEPETVNEPSPIISTDEELDNVLTNEFVQDKKETAILQEPISEELPINEELPIEESVKDENPKIAISSLTDLDARKADVFQENEWRPVKPELMSKYKDSVS